MTLLLNILLKNNIYKTLNISKKQIVYLVHLKNTISPVGTYANYSYIFVVAKGKSPD